MCTARVCTCRTVITAHVCTCERGVCSWHVCACRNMCACECVGVCEHFMWRGWVISGRVGKDLMSVENRPEKKNQQHKFVFPVEQKNGKIPHVSLLRLDSSISPINRINIQVRHKCPRANTQIHGGTDPCSPSGLAARLGLQPLLHGGAAYGTRSPHSPQSPGPCSSRCWRQRGSARGSPSWAEGE